MFQLAVQREFVAYCNPTKQASISITGSGKDMPKSMNLTMTGTDIRGLYTAHASFSPQSKGNLVYEVKYQQLGGWMWDKSTSVPTELPSNPVQRVIISKHTHMGVKAHLEDITRRKHVPFKEMCLQTKSLCLKYSLVHPEDILDPLPENDTGLAVLTLAICLLRKRQGLIDSIKKEHANTLLRALAKYKLDDFPDSCAHIILVGCKELFKIANPGKYSLCLLIYKLFNFLNQNAITYMLQQHDNEICCPKNDNSPDDLFQLLHGNRGLDDPNEIKTILIQRLPFKWSIQMLVTYCADCKDDSQVFETCKRKCIEELKFLRFNKDLEGLLKFPIPYRKTNLFSDATLKHKVEKSVLEVLRTITKNKDPDIGRLFKTFIDSGYCCIEDENKFQLLEALASSPSPSLREVFLNFLERENFRVSLNLEPGKVYLIWLEKDIQHRRSVFHQRGPMDKSYLFYLFRGASVLFEHDIGEASRQSIKDYINSKAEQCIALEDFFKVSEFVQHICFNEGDANKSKWIQELRKLYLKIFEQKLKNNTHLGLDDMLSRCSVDEGLVIQTR